MLMQNRPSSIFANKVVIYVGKMVTCYGKMIFFYLFLSFNKLQ